MSSAFIVVAEGKAEDDRGVFYRLLVKSKEIYSIWHNVSFKPPVVSFGRRDAQTLVDDRGRARY